LTEFEQGHVKGAIHAFVGTLEDNLEKIDSNKQVVIHCQAGDRSALAASILARNGYSNVKNFSGGMKEWLLNHEEVITKN
jgi:hydroxyacylglutathione hydrolase